MRPLNFYEWNRRENKARKIDADADDKLLHSLTVGCRDCDIDKQKVSYAEVFFDFSTCFGNHPDDL
jgi:hypothetical protein